MLNRALHCVDDQTHPTEPIVIEGGPNPAWARNRGLEQSSARFVAFLDADDYWKPVKLEKQYGTITDERAALCLNTAELTDGSRNDIVAPSAQQFAKLLFCGHQSGITSSMLVDTERTTAIFNESIYRREDHLFALEVIHDGGYCCIDDVLTHVEKHETGLSENVDYDRKLESYELFYERAIELFPALQNYSEEYWAQAWYNTGRGYYYCDEFRRSLSYLWRSLRTAPRAKTAAAIGASAVRYLVSRFD
jgi:glycosyltransferase involved in cell wall biosynthesis